MSPHGGKREGAGRPTVAKKTANLCGVRVTPHQLAAYKKAAGMSHITLSEWVTFHLNLTAEEYLNFYSIEQSRKRHAEASAAFYARKYGREMTEEMKTALDIRGFTIDAEPKKRKGKKS